MPRAAVSRVSSCEPRHHGPRRWWGWRRGRRCRGGCVVGLATRNHVVGCRRRRGGRRVGYPSGGRCRDSSGSMGAGRGRVGGRRRRGGRVGTSRGCGGSHDGGERHRVGGGVLGGVLGGAVGGAVGDDVGGLDARGRVAGRRRRRWCRRGWRRWRHRAAMSGASPRSRPCGYRLRRHGCARRHGSGRAGGGAVGGAAGSSVEGPASRGRVVGRCRRHGGGRRRVAVGAWLRRADRGSVVDVATARALTPTSVER